MAKDRGRDRDREVEEVDNEIKGRPITGTRDALHRSSKDPVRFLRSQSLHNRKKDRGRLQENIQTSYTIFKETMKN